MIGWWSDKHHKIWLKATALLLSIAFAYTTICSPIAEANFWKERRAAQEAWRKQHAKGLVAPRRTYSASFLPLAGLPIPPERGSIVESYWSKTKKTPLVIHIQDIHSMYGAQQNAAFILQALQKDSPPAKLVAVEGAWGPIETDWLAAFPNQAIKAAILQSHLYRGELNGEEYLAILHGPESLNIYGSEDPQLYKANVGLKNSCFYSLVGESRSCLPAISTERQAYGRRP